MAFDIRKLQKEIGELQKEFSVAFNKRAEASRVEKLQSLAPGEMVPASGKIYGEDHRKRFEEQAAEIRHKGFDLIDKARSEINRDISAAPSADAVNALSMLALRSDVSQEEIDALLDSYGSNYQTYKAIRDVAGKHKRHVPTHTLDQDMTALDGETRVVNSLSLTGAESGGAADPAMIAFRSWWNGDET